MILDLKDRSFLKEAGEFIGYVKYRLNSYELEIEKLFVRRTFRRRGYALKMLDHLSQKNLPIVLEVSVSNTAAVNCYLKAGFKKNRLRKNYYKDGSDALEMVKVCH
jgi:ribosomal protein S18 acetylase RimI-like enzyme